MNTHIPAFAKDTKQTIKVGIPLRAGFLEIDSNGEYKGYMDTYLQEISQYTAWDYEIISDHDLHDGEDLYTMLDEGALDAVMGVAVRDENKHSYIFTEKNIGNSYVTLAVSTQDTTHVPNDYQSYNGMSIGYLQEDERSLQAIRLFANSYSFHFEEIMYTSYEQLRQDVKNQKIDAMVGLDIVAEDDLRINNRFSSTPIGIIVQKDQMDIFADLNFAIDSIHEVNMNYDIQLYDTFFPKTMPSKLVLSEEEKAYLSTLPALRVVSGTNSIPLDYFENGVYKGIHADMLEKISELTGIRFQYMRADSVDEAYKSILADEADVVTDVYHDSIKLMHKDITYVSPLGNIQMVIIKNNKVKKQELSNLTMALPKRFHSVDEIQAKEVKHYDSLEDCMLAIQRGNADFVYASTYAVEYYVRKHGITNAELSLIPNSSRALMLGTSKHVDPRLVTILNKAIRSISEEEKQQIYFHSIFNANNDVTLPAFIRMHFAKVLLGAVFVMLFFCWCMLRSLKKKRKEELANARRYQMMAELSGDFIFEYNFRKDQLLISRMDAERLGVPPVIDNYLKSVKNEEFFYTMEDMHMISEEELHDPALTCIQRDLPWTSIDGKNYQLHALIMFERDEKNNPQVCIGRLSKVSVN